MYYTQSPKIPWSCTRHPVSRHTLESQYSTTRPRTHLQHHNAHTSNKLCSRHRRTPSWYGRMSSVPRLTTQPSNKLCAPHKLNSCFGSSTSNATQLKDNKCEMLPLVALTSGKKHVACKLLRRLGLVRGGGRASSRAGAKGSATMHKVRR